MRLNARDNGLGTETSSTFTPTSSWQRFSMQFTSGSTTTSMAIYLGGADGTFQAWGAQVNAGAAATTYVATTAAAVTGNPSLSFSGAPYIGLQSDGSLYETSAGTSPIRFYTNNIGQEQARISHTTNAVNYVQVTGAATGGNPTISSQGSDATIGLSFVTKGGFGMQFNNSSGGSIVQYTQSGTTSATTNYLRFTNYNGTGTSPIISTQGGDPNIDLTLTPKGSGAVKTTSNAYVGSNLYIAP
jgi:hypothetical protein